MEALSVRDQIIGQIDRLTPEQQQQVLDFTNSVSKSDEALPPGTPGSVLLERMKHIRIDPADLAAMEQAIEEEFEKIDLNEWDKPIFPD